MSEQDNNSSYHTRHSLLDRVKDQNDKEAWSEFVGYYEQFIYNLLRHMKFPESDADEVCQEIIVRLWKKLPDFTYNKDRGKFRSWLHTVIRNEANRFLKKTSRKNQFIQSEEQEILESHPEDDEKHEIDTLIEDEWKAYIASLAWDSVKERFQENVQKVFLLYSNGKSVPEISEECGIAVSSVRVYIRRIRAHLETEIDRFNQELL